MKRGLTALFVGALALAASAETAAAIGATSPFLSSKVCMSAPAFVALLLTPTAAIGEQMSKRFKTNA